MRLSIVRNILLAVYVLIVLGISATARANQSILPIFTESELQAYSQSFEGDVVADLDGHFYLIVSNERYFELKTNIELDAYVGQRVQVLGVEVIKRKVGPVVQSESLDPLPGSQRKAAAVPLLVVLEIKDIAE